MSKPKWLGKDETIVAVYPERAAGPGWGNRIFWCVVQDGNKKVRLEALQPEDWNPDLFLLFPILVAAHAELMKVIDRLFSKRRGTG